ncbi:MAG TPA: DUF4139 domain-containing protein [Bryobacteraceae bacterium]|nr:DUF4139 domain-containing protein [Bryobacteraceae bacterium]
MKQIVGMLVMAAFAASAADLPVRQVVLYKHGVGYFERFGQLGPGEAARLDFKASEMNDVLKSLTVEDKGGKISGLRYDSSEPLAQKLADFPFQLGGAQPLSAVLDQLKGARVELRFGSGNVAGAIVGARLVPGDEKRAEHDQITLLLDGGDLSTFDLSAAAGLRFPDPALQAQFKDYLAALNGARSKEKRSVYIDSSDAKAREIAAGYMVPMPVWKSSYRLIFPETGQPTLEGWAIVDNTTGEDWTNVRLSLVSGRPVSFVSRLYEPRYLTRQTAELPEEQAMAPVVHDAQVESSDKQEALVAGGRQFKTTAPMAAPPPAFKADMQYMNRRGAASSIAATAAGREAGDLFEYRIAAPVTVRKSESAMLPFIQQAVDARKLLIYSDASAAHPMNAAEIANSTGKTLDGGPVTIYDGGVYGGEGLFETFKSGDKRLISYAVDLGTRITTAFDSKADTVRELRAQRGILTTRTAAIETRTYTIHNVDKKAKTLVIEHPARPEYTLLERKPAEKTARAYRFEVKLAPGATEKFPVTEERVYDQTVTIASLTPDVLLTHIRNKTLSDAVRRQLEQIAALKQQIAAADQQIRQSEARISEIARDQDRIRQNIASLSRVSGQQQQVQTYANQLAGQEAELAKLRDTADAQRKQKTALEGDLANRIASVEF